MFGGFSGFFPLVFMYLVGTTFASTFIRTNEVEEKSDDLTLDIGTCVPDAICGYLQANANGINMQRRCACDGGVKCPMNWDASDGQSVTQGSDQYKFCGPAPAVRTCDNAMAPAYTSRVVYVKDTDEVLTNSDKIHCNCPEGANYVLANRKFDTHDADSETMVLTYVCSPLPRCKVGEYCKHVSVNTKEFLVQRRCICPDDLRCPTETSDGVKTSTYGNGLVHYIRCQH